MRFSATHAHLLIMLGSKQAIESAFWSGRGLTTGADSAAIMKGINDKACKALGFTPASSKCPQMCSAGDGGEFAGLCHSAAAFILNGDVWNGNSAGAKRRRYGKYDATQVELQSHQQLRTARLFRSTEASGSGGASDLSWLMDESRPIRKLVTEALLLSKLEWLDANSSGDGCVGTPAPGEVRLERQC